MHILLAGQAYFREDNGQAVFTVRLAKGLAHKGHRVMVLAPTANGRFGSVQRQGVEVWQIRTRSLPHNVNISLLPAKAVKKAIDSCRPDIIHLQDHYFISKAAWKIGRHKNIPVVATNHFLPENLSANLPLPEICKGPVNKLLWKHMLSLYNRIAAVSTPTKTAAALLQEQHILPEVNPISCGIDTVRFQPCNDSRRAQLQKKYKLPEQGPTFLYVGRLDHEKGLDTAIKAFATIDRSCSRLVLAGKGSYYKALMTLCQKLHIEDRVLFPGFIAEEDLPRLLNCADCFLMPGFAELQSIATLEAMACGRPIVAAEAKALPELVSHGKNGLLFTPQDVPSLAEAMQRFINAPEQWAAWGAASRKKAKEHNLDTTIEQYVDWYTGMIPGKNLSTSWKTLSPRRQLALREEFGLHQDTLPPTCCLETKTNRFQNWLQDRGISY